jgi:hypothetical protein
MNDTVHTRDVEFALSFLSPKDVRIQYPEHMLEILDSPKTTTYAVAKCETSQGPFVCILPLDGFAALKERDLAKKLVSAAYDELARCWVEEGYDKA